VHQRCHGEGRSSRGALGSLLSARMRKPPMHSSTLHARSDPRALAQSSLRLPASPSATWHGEPRGAFCLRARAGVDPRPNDATSIAPTCNVSHNATLDQPSTTASSPFGRQHILVAVLGSHDQHDKCRHVACELRRRAHRPGKWARRITMSSRFHTFLRPKKERSVRQREAGVTRNGSE
jgi:hypothetical protein